MRFLSIISLLGFFFSFGPTSSLGFVTNPKVVPRPTLSSIKIEKSPLIHIQPRVSKLDISTSTAIHAVTPDLLACFLPPSMGFFKTEWTVSYGYGFATAFSALSILLRQQNSMLTTLHATGLVFFGLRLNIFLYLRNRLSPRYQEINKRIEERSNEKYSTAISRAPFVLSCGLLFYGLYMPVLLTSKLTSDAVAAKSAAGIGLSVLKLLVGMQWLGFLSEAVGDLTKSYVKGTEKDGKFLVTSGIFSILRHPNYSGEILAWTSNLLCGAVSTAYLLRSQFSFSLLGCLGLSTLGAGGMVSVLLRATSNLEERQKKDYGDTEKYKAWVQRTWSGWTLPSKADEEEQEVPQITLNAEVEEDFGSGI